MERVRSMLRMMGLARYARQFEELGYDDADFIDSLAGSELRELAKDVGMSDVDGNDFVRWRLALGECEREKSAALPSRLLEHSAAMRGVHEAGASAPQTARPRKRSRLSLSKQAGAQSQLEHTKHAASFTPASSCR